MCLVAHDLGFSDCANTRFCRTRCEAVFHSEYEAAARSLGTDRSADLLPVVVAIFGLCASVVQKYIYTLWLKKDEFDESNPQHMNIWSLSSSLVMIHVIPNVLLASFIGVQSSRFAAQRFLQELESHIKNEGSRPSQNALPDTTVSQSPRLALAPSEGERRAREQHTQQLRFRAYRDETTVNNNKQLENIMKTNWTAAENIEAAQIQYGIPGFRPDRPFLYDIVAFLIVAAPAIGATILAWMVPPEGFNCRARVKILMLGVYIGKYLVQCGVNLVFGRRWHFPPLSILRRRQLETTPRLSIILWRHGYVTGVLDLVCFLGFCAIIFVTQIGYLNRPSCYRHVAINGEGVIVPLEYTFPIVRQRMGNWYPGILFGLIGVIVVLSFLPRFYWFRSARKVYLQEEAPPPVSHHGPPPSSQSGGSNIPLVNVSGNGCQIDHGLPSIPQGESLGLFGAQDQV